MAGYTRPSEGALCDKCEPATFKEAVKDDPCDGVCMNGATTMPGATRKEDCFCLEGRFYRTDPESGQSTCKLCNAASLVCTGGRDAQGSHVPPAANPGFYDATGHFHQEPPPASRDVDVPDARAEQQRKQGGYYDDAGRRWDAASTKDSFDPFPGGYPVPREETESFKASAPVRPLLRPSSDISSQIFCQLPSPWSWMPSASA